MVNDILEDDLTLRVISAMSMNPKTKPLVSMLNFLSYEEDRRRKIIEEERAYNDKVEENSRN